jgi:hypothetical protein
VTELSDLKPVTDIPGWFFELDQRLFTHFLAEDAVVPRGDLVELGTYMGKSAALMGQFLHPGETFTVLDLFGATPGDEQNAVENARSYSQLTRDRFEQYYLSVNAELPVIVQDFSSAIVDHVKPGSARFVHVDASHLYQHVAVDVESARQILLPDGVAAFDDYRSEHTPGVAAAVWEAVVSRGLNPIAISGQKFYGTFGDAAPHQQRLLEWSRSRQGYWTETVDVAGRPLVRIALKKTAPQQGAGQKSNSPSADASLTKRLDRIDERLAAVQRELNAGSLSGAGRRAVRGGRRALRATRRWVASARR